MESETFVSEWFRTTWITRKRAIHEQLAELGGFEPIRLVLTPAERAVLDGTEMLKRAHCRLIVSSVLQDATIDPVRANP